MADEKDDGYIRFYCNSCGKRLKIRKTYEGGGFVRCPRCGEQVTVPLANIEKIAQAPGLSDDTDRKNINRLDPDLLLRQLREGDEGFEGKSKGAAPPAAGPSGKWRPELTYGMIEELDSIRAQLNKIEDEVVAEMQRLLRIREMPREDVLKEMRLIAEQRREEIGKLCRERLEDVKRKYRELEARKGVLKGAAVQRLDKLERTVDALEMYFHGVLGLDI